ncbi:uncharacterized protein LOC123490065 [Coregonus clupeaformis]|uniref:uncharacterized protein LOC123490065 n=1 Tax=Coregonus clupeaformis TaxID=59861 RepID=UPI001E1C93AA|nr:uncharacterized protein LOC123490065 [Coregonus clupeaformis]
MALYSSSIKWLVIVILVLHHLDGKDFRDNLMPPMGIWQWASMPHIELKTNTINFHQRPWTTQNTNETLWRWIGGKALRQTCVLSRGCTSSCLMLQKQEIGSCPMGHCGFDKPTTTQTRNSIDQKYRDVSALHQTTSDSTASRRTRRPRVAELRSRERAGASELVWKKTNTINFHQRPWTTQNTNETIGHSLHKCTGEACVMVSLEPTATRVATNNTNQLSGLVVSVSALRLEGRVVYPRSNHTKDSKNGTWCLSAWHTLWKWIGGKALRQTCVLSRGCTSSCLMLQKQEIGSCPMGHCGFDKPTTTQTRDSIDQKYRDVSALHQTTSDSTASRRTRRPRVAELRSRERAGASELVWKKTNTINFHQRPWTTQNTNETTGHSLHKCTGEACVMVSLEPTATRVATNNTNQLSGLVVSVSALRLEGRVVYPRSNHTKDSENGTCRRTRRPE